MIEHRHKLLISSTLWVDDSSFFKKLSALSISFLLIRCPGEVDRNWHMGCLLSAATRQL